MKKEKWLFTFLIILALSVSGCTFFQGKREGPGVIIEEFRSDFPTVYSGEPFKLYLKLRNTGSFDALAIYPVLYNVNMESGDTTNTEITCKDTCEISKLLAPDPERGLSGGVETCAYECQAPKGIPKGQSIDYNPMVRVYYVYKTDTIKSITILSQSELKALQDKGEALPSEIISTTSGPITTDIQVKGPIRYWEDTSSVSFPMGIVVTNIGGGTSCLLPTFLTSVEKTEVIGGCEEAKNWNKVYLELMSKDIFLDGCELSKNQAEIRLWEGKSASLTCAATVRFLPERGYVKKNIEIMASYDYFKEASTSIRVIGK